jgi:hypothetical protein
MGSKKDKRFLILVATCSVAGVALGGTAGWAESNQCFQAAQPTSECLSETPKTKTIEGMGFGLVAGVGSALGATWNLRTKE